MPASLYSLWEVQSLGSDLNGGCFDPNPTMSPTLFTGNGTSFYPTVTANDYTFVNNDVGHYLFIQSGTSWRPGYYQITGIANTSAVVNAIGSSTIQANNQPGYLDGVSTTASVSSGRWAIDYTRKPTARLAYNDLVLTTSTIVSSTGNSFTPAMTGNTLRILSGTGFTAGFYSIVSSSTGYTAALDRAAGTQGSTGGTGYLGGALASVTGAYIGGTTIVNDKTIIYVKNDAVYNWSSNIFVPGNAFSPCIHGYGTLRTDNQKVTVNLGANSTYISRPSHILKLFNFIFDGQNNANTYGVNNPAFYLVHNCEFKNMVGNIGSAYAIKSLYKNCSLPGASTYLECVISGCATTYSALIYDASIIECLVMNNTAPTNLISFNMGYTFGTFDQNIFYNNSCKYVLYANQVDFRSMIHSINNIFVGNGGTVYTHSPGGTTYLYDIINNAYFNNLDIGSEPANDINSPGYFVFNEILLSANPFVNPSNGNFNINDLPGGGQLIKAAQYENQSSLLSNNTNDKNLGIFQNKAIPKSLSLGGGIN